MNEAPTQTDEQVSTYVPVTRGERWGGKEGRTEGGEGLPEADSTRPRARMRARDRMLTAAGAVTHGVQIRGASWRQKTADEAAAPDINETDVGVRRSFWRDGPAPAADVVGYTRSGAWLRGDRNAWLERGGKVWGYGVALPVTLILGALIWCSHRFHRAAVVVVILAVLYVSAPACSSPADPGPAPAVAPIGATP